MSRQNLLLIDGNGILYRAFYAFPPLVSPQGEAIGAVYGFARILLSALKTLQPSHVAVSFDLPEPTFRHTQYEAYKATRQKMPDELATQIPRTYAIVEHLEIPVYTASGFEADDVIGTLASEAAHRMQPPLQVTILTGDMDLLQLVDEQVQVYSPHLGKSGAALYTPSLVVEKYGFKPSQIVEYKALCGDSSDNIPGVPGIGPVTATKLVQEYGSVAALYTALSRGETDGIAPATLKKLVEHQAGAELSRTLATIRTDVPVTFDLDRCRMELLHPEHLIHLFEELGFKSLIRELPQSHRLPSEVADIFQIDATAVSIPKPAAPEPDPTQPTCAADSIDAELEPILRQMESVGVRVDCAYLKELEGEYATEISAIRQQLIDLAGEEFNPDSPQQVGRILYEVLLIPTHGITRKKTGFTTDAATLQGLARQYPIAQVLLQYRERMKLLSTYVKPLQELADAESRVHTSYAPDTVTGRISSKSPNLQNIPNRSDEGRRIRQAFVAAPGQILTAADYSQIELRIAAHLSGDENMQAVFREGGDFHTATAERMQVDRFTAKVINFSILYGKGAFGFAQDLGISIEEARKYIDQYFKTYGKLREYLDSILEHARKRGYAETLYGRRRAFPEITAANARHRAAAEREALNYPIQGTAAEIFKMAMCRVSEALQTRKLRTQMILTVHDELVLEGPPEERGEISRLLIECMTSAASLSVPLTVQVKQGPNWAALDTVP